MEVMSDAISIGTPKTLETSGSETSGLSDTPGLSGTPGLSKISKLSDTLGTVRGGEKSSHLASSGSSTTASTETTLSGSETKKSKNLVVEVMEALLKFLKGAETRQTSLKASSSESETKELKNPLVAILELLLKIAEEGNQNSHQDQGTDENIASRSQPKKNNGLLVTVLRALLAMAKLTEQGEQRTPQPNNPITTQEAGLPSSASGTNSGSGVDIIEESVAPSSKIGINSATEHTPSSPLHAST